ncbi:MAG TPA: guanylate kinase [Aestuariivirgaceae bacterium]
MNKEPKESKLEVGRRGLLLVISSPSGAGKTTLSRMLLESDRNIIMSVSVTTRPQRPGEVEGVDYKFISKDRFDAMRDRGELLESAEVFGHWYGTPRLPVEKSLSMGRDVLFDIDWQGTQQLAEVMREDLVTIFILPPSAEVLHDRLINRAQDAMVVVAKRMAEASKEISHWAEYDYVIINQDLEVAGREISMILAAERLKRKRRTGLATFVRSLTEKL